MKTREKTTDALKLYAETSDARLYQAIHASLKTLEAQMFRVARDLAESRAEWMDDPEDERYEFWHAPAGEQFPEDVRLRVLRDMLCHQIEEKLIQLDGN